MATLQGFVCKTLHTSPAADDHQGQDLAKAATWTKIALLLAGNGSTTVLLWPGVSCSKF